MAQKSPLQEVADFFPFLLFSFGAIALLFNERHIIKVGPVPRFGIAR
jgi:hypothetical protein